MDFRLLNTGFSTAAKNMAIDEAVLESVASGESLPTLRLYGWSPAAVSIGYFQSLEEEVDLDACRKFGVDFVRRQTGGGAVFHDKEITYSIHIPESSGIVPAGILESYEKICGGVIKGVAGLCKMAGVNDIGAKFVPLNDIVIPSGLAVKKISGNAQTRKKGVILQHGTILLEADIEKMFALLKVPDEKLKGKMIATIKERVTGLYQALGKSLSFEQASAAFTEGFRLEFSPHNFEKGELTTAELALTEKLIKEKYGSRDWNFAR